MLKIIIPEICSRAFSVRISGYDAQKRSPDFFLRFAAAQKDGEIFVCSFIITVEKCPLLC
jgi:hypothetical protein